MLLQQKFPKALYWVGAALVLIAFFFINKESETLDATIGGEGDNAGEEEEGVVWVDLNRFANLWVGSGLGNASIRCIHVRLFAEPTTPNLNSRVIVSEVGSTR